MTQVSIAPSRRKGLIPVITSCFLLFMSFNGFSQSNCEDVQASILFNLDQCQAGPSFQEFTATNNTQSGFLDINVVNNHLYRNNPTINSHSCTEGVNGSVGMCIDANNSCNYEAGSDKSLIIDLELVPNTVDARLKEISFYEMAPEVFSWVTGGTGLNNYPTQFGIRVLRNGTEIWNESGIATSMDYTLQTFNFPNNEDFTISQTTNFTIELLPYCLAGNGGFISVWDLDEIQVTGMSSTNTMANGGTLEGGPFSFCVGDGVADNIPDNGITLSGNTGNNSQWVITDDQGNILGLPPTFSAVDFDGAPVGVCLIWHLSYEDGLTGLEAGNNAADLQGCFSLSNPIEVNRNQPNGGTLEGGPFSFCVGDGVADNIPVDGITLSGNTGTNSQWVVTDDQGNILGLPPTFSAVDFDGAPAGVCLVWHLSYEDGLTGAEMGMNAADLQGCFSLSNPIEVNRNQPNGGTLEGGPFSFCVGDGVADNIPVDGITLSGNTGSNSQWVVTDDQGNILGLPPTFSAVNFDGAPAGVCLVWHLSFEDGLTGAEMGMNAADLQGCFSLSNPIEVNRNQPNGGTLEGGPFSFCVGDGVADNIPDDGITLSGNTGNNSQWVVTDDQGNILGLPPTFSAVDFDGAPAGVCLVWHLSYEDGLTGAEMGMNAADLQGCFSLSNPIEVNRNQPNGGTLEGGPFSFCVGDGVADNIPVDGITLSGNTGTNSQWVVTDDQGNILGLPPTFSAVDFDGAPAGVCLVWHLSYEDGLTGLEAGNNAADLQGCFSLSNPIEVNRNQPNGGTLEGGPFSFCVGDGVADNIPVDGITLSGNTGTNSQWVVTDDQGNILGLPPTFSAVDFDGAPAGVCLVWHLSYEDGLTGLEAGNNASDLQGCFSLSNPIEVNRNQPNGGTLEGGPFSFDAIGDGTPDMIPAGSITLANANGANSQWVVTDANGIILGLPPMPSVVDFDGAGAGNCLIWHLAYEGTITGAEVGSNAADITGCFSLSNSIEVIRNNADGCQANGGELFGGPFTFNEIGDGTPDMIPAGSITLANANGANSQWVVTDANGIILGLPPMPSVVDFDGAGAGNCLIWHLAYEGTITGAEVGSNAADITGCFSLSNSIEVIRNNADGCQANGGELFGGPFTFNEIGDGTPDMIPAGSITLANSSGMNSQWIITDDQGNILGLPSMPSDVDFDGAGPGTCLIWHLSYDDGIMGLEMGMNASDLVGCFSLSNSIEVIRNTLFQTPNNTSSRLKINVFPNPSTDYIMVENEKLNSIDQIEIYRLDGSRVWISNPTEKQETTKIDLSSFSNGQYYLMVRSARQKITKKFVVVK